MTRKITIGVAKIFYSKVNTIYLGNLDSKRDWGHAKDYVEGMWKMLQYKNPQDYILATGESHSVGILIKALSIVGIKISFSGKKSDEVDCYRK